MAASTTPLVLALNAGSSTLKFALFQADDPPQLTLAGKIERIGLPDAKMKWHAAAAQSSRTNPVLAPDQSAAVRLALDCVEQQADAKTIAAVGHRVVHGGMKYTQPVIVTPDVLAELRRLSPYAPEHLPAEIAVIEAVGTKFPNVPQVACFDTAFHHGLPRVAQLLAIPRRFEAKGVRRYGFHGLSYEFLMEELTRIAGADAARGRVILAHLGNGSSLAAVREGRSIDTSMGFTPTAGVPMSTRSGDLDPGLVRFLVSHEGMTPEAFHSMVNQKSGLLGLSETSPDMRDLLVMERTDTRAAEAVALFCYQVKKWIGAFAAALGGLDTLVFSGGIGENAAVVRQRVCQGLEFLGVELDLEQNAANAGVISNEAGRVAVRVIRTDEEWLIAETVCRILRLPTARKKIDPLPQS